MRRIFDDYAYGSGPRNGCWWDETCTIDARPMLQGSRKTDVVVIGAGVTGLSAAKTLAEHGVDVCVIDMHHIGWGASGRNGGFCCLGGSKAEDDEIDRIYGKEARLEFRSAEKLAVQHVETFLNDHDIDVDRHSVGETALAHRPKDKLDFENSIRAYEENYGFTPYVIEKQDLATKGFGGGPFYGGLTIPVGFGLNPRKYVKGLANAAEKAGARIFEKTPVTKVEPVSGGWRVCSATDTIDARDVLFATNGYSAEAVPPWLAGRYMPSQSTVLVTRPMSQIELDAQGWTSDQMSYDTRYLLHYFRLMPDRRFLFGMRGGIRTGPEAERRARRRTRADFEKMFPEWRSVESEASWSGFVSLARRKMPFVGRVPDQTGLWISMCYHGNGVAMGSYSGHLVAQQMLSGASDQTPKTMQLPLKKFPFGRWRRGLMPPLYAQLMLKDL